jgi:predicted tellurium resistance membrane protein TerC
MIGWLFDVETLAAVLTLTALELVLGIDNVVFIAILAGKLPPAERDRVRIIGLVLAGAGRIALLFSIVWIMASPRTCSTSSAGVCRGAISSCCSPSPSC